MFARLLVFIGLVLLIVGLLKFFGVIALVAAGAVALIVVGLILIGLGEYVFGGGFLGRTGTYRRGV